MQSPRLRPVLLIGLLSLAKGTVLGGLAPPDLPTDFLEGFLDGLGVASIFGSLLALGLRRLRRL
jgi:hypothetical protein